MFVAFQTQLSQQAFPNATSERSDYREQISHLIGGVWIHICLLLQWVMLIAHPPICTDDGWNIMRIAKTKCLEAVAGLHHHSNFEGYFSHPPPPAGASNPPGTASAAGSGVGLRVAAPVTGITHGQQMSQVRTNTLVQTQKHANWPHAHAQTPNKHAQNIWCLSHFLIISNSCPLEVYSWLVVCLHLFMHVCPCK